MLKKSIIIAVVFFCFNSCSRMSSGLFHKNEIYCKNIQPYKIEDIHFVNNKEFKKISKLLKTKYGATSIRNIFYIKSTGFYYTDFYINNYIIQCVVLGKEMECISREEIHFDW